MIDILEAAWKGMQFIKEYKESVDGMTIEGL